jgi:hypothetical protein
MASVRFPKGDGLALCPCPEGTKSFFLNKLIANACFARSPCVDLPSFLLFAQRLVVCGVGPYLQGWWALVLEGAAVRQAAGVSYSSTHLPIMAYAFGRNREML